MAPSRISLILALTGGLLPAMTRGDPPEKASRQPEVVPAPAWVEKARAGVRSYAVQILEEGRTPGMVVALTSRDGWLAVDAFGLEDLKTKRPMSPQTPFQVGSISKTLTAVALLRLFDQDRFDPQAPIAEYLPWFEVKTRFAPLTGHHLLSHTSGLPRNRDDLPSSRYSAYAVREQAVVYPPGERFHYSNVGYQVLHSVLEAIERRPYAAAMEDLVLRPLGLHGARASITTDLRRELAQGYQPLYDDRPVHPSHPQVEATWLEYDAGDGSIVMTAADLAAFLRMLIRRGAAPGAEERFLSEEAFELLLDPPGVPEGALGLGRYGYGIVSSREEERTEIFHWGGMVGFISAMHGDLDSGLGAVAFVNGGPGRAIPMARFALRALHDAREGRAVLDPPPPDDRRRIPNAADYAGTFRSLAGDAELTLIAEGARLTAASTAWPAGVRVPLESYEEDGLYAAHPEVSGLDLFLFRFERDFDGSVREVFHGEAGYLKKGRTREAEPEFPARWRAYRGHYRSFSPWFSNFRVLLKRGALYLLTPRSPETSFAVHRLLELEPGLFQVGEELSPERIRFDSVVDGRALRASWTGHPFYRFFTP